MCRAVASCHDPLSTGLQVHERSLDSDFLAVVLRDLLARRPELRLVLMSATLNAEAFADYFRYRPRPLRLAVRLDRGAVLPDAGTGRAGGAYGGSQMGEQFSDMWEDGARQVALVHIPGFTHPVVDFFLEDALELCLRVPEVGMAGISQGEACSVDCQLACVQAMCMLNEVRDGAKGERRGKGRGGTSNAEWDEEEAEEGNKQKLMEARAEALLQAGVPWEVVKQCTLDFNEEGDHSIICALVSHRARLNPKASVACHQYCKHKLFAQT